MANGANILTEVRVNDHGAIERLEKFPELQKIATMRAVNRTLAWSRTRTLNAITNKIAVKKRDLDGKHRFGGVTVTKAAPERGGTLVVTGGRVPLFRFGGTPDEPPHPAGAPGGSISYQILAGGGRVTRTRALFMAQMKSGHKGFFRRLPGGARIRIEAKGGKRKGHMISSQVGLAELWGPSIPQVAKTDPEFQALLKVNAGERLELEMARAVEFMLTGKGIESVGGDDAEGD